MKEVKVTVKGVELTRGEIEGLLKEVQQKEKEEGARLELLPWHKMGMNPESFDAAHGRAFEMRLDGSF